MSNPMPGSPGFPHQSPKSGGTSVVKILLIVLAVLGLGCVCCGLIGYFGWTFSVGVLNEQAAAKASQVQIVKDSYGDLEAKDVAANIMASGEMQQKYGRPVLVFDADGPLGGGKLVFEQASPGSPDSLGRLIAIEINGEMVDVN